MSSHYILRKVNLQNSRHFPAKILVTLLYLLFIYAVHVFDMQCVYLHLFHIKCPGCGMTHAMLSVLHGNFGEAFSNNPMFWSVPVLYMFFLMDGHIFKSKHMNHVALALIISGFAAVFVYRLF